MTLICTACGVEIRSGERYVSTNRHVETFKRNTVTVHNAEMTGAWHQACAPAK